MDMEWWTPTGDARGYINHAKALDILMKNLDRKVQVPLSDVKTCSRCGKKGERFPVCKGCGEKAYCGKTCQTVDWESHKRQCGKTDRIDLLAFIPMIATLMEWYRHDNLASTYNISVYPALRHQIVNSPNPDAPLDQLSDGSSTRLVRLGDPMSPEEVIENPEKWWPTASNDQVRSRLRRRIESERFLLPSMVAILMAIMGEMYTTKYLPAEDTYDNKMKRRIRLKYRDSPISDFGIVKGSFDVKPEDTLAYEGSDQGVYRFMRGLIPTNHYWMYFTTASGEELILDCGLYAFNRCQVVNTRRYGLELDPPIRDAPFYFYDRSERKPPVVHDEKERFSMLRDYDLKDAIQWTERASSRQEREEHLKALAHWLGEFMERLEGNTITADVKNLTAARCLETLDELAVRFLERPVYLDYTAVSDSDVETK
ncbi:hypothetical protein DFP72DRAFT_861576 [Ephemerocybe angulata]|uniref:MYND-type domain-containing protein n=1 Tax=Ephemerocybe angulata TaxID=980116 RepID=A0A8H6H899_9AGAR|nr:hypothetical protein DFP72DRAFT_861576 [Tulosesus angulatus]